MTKLTVGSLFAGIGGIERGLEMTGGFETVWQCENDKYATRVLEKHWPDVRRWGDVRTFPPEPVDDWHCDLVAGGFPCQPVSDAGKRKAESDPRWLWPQFRRVLGILRPRLALIENVPGLLTRSGAGVLFDLATLGYDAEWRTLSAREFGAPHIRKRVFIVAYSGGQRALFKPGWFAGASWQSQVHVNGDGTIRHVADSDSHSERQSQRPKQNSASKGGNQTSRRNDIGGLRDDVADAERDGWQQGSEVLREGELESANGGNTLPDTEGERRDGRILDEYEQDERAWIEGHHAWTIEPDVGRVAYGIPHRVDRLRCLGNAVVPAVAQWIGERILEAETNST